MVHPAFDIRKNDLANSPADCQLLIEISAQAFNYILFSRSPDQLFLLRQYRIYTSSDKTYRDVLEEIISGDEVLQKYADKAIVVYNFPEANIVPSELFNNTVKSAATKLVYGNTDHHFIFDEEIGDQGMRNIYFVSKDLHSLCKEKFKGSKFWHLYTMILKSADALRHAGETSARVIFYNDKFIVTVYKDGALQLIQTFAYQTPEDAAYYLLLICKQFGINQYEFVLNISGLIDAQSPLYTELLKYFAHVNHEGVPATYGTNGLLDEYPSHYFSPLLKLSLCV